MSFFSEIASGLSRAIRHEGSARASFWSSKTLGELFDKKGNRLIKPREVASLFFQGTLDELRQGNTAFADLTPQQAEEALCARYRVYKTSWFLSRFWMWLTQPVGIYQGIYTMVTLRELQKGCDVAGQHAGHLDPAGWSNFFDAAMAALGTWLGSLLPRETSFLGRIFESEDINSHITLLQSFEDKVLAKLKKGIETSFLGQTEKALVCLTREEQEQFNEGIAKSHKEQTDSITRHIIENQQVCADERSEAYSQILDNLKNKLHLLRAAAEVSIENAMGQCQGEVLPQETGEQIDSAHIELVMRLENLDNGFTVLMDNSKCRYRYTYRLEQRKGSFWGLTDGWKLYYHGKQSEEEELKVNDIPGLAGELEKNDPSLANIRESIRDFHYGERDPEGFDSAREYHARVIKASPRKCARAMLGQYIRKNIPDVTSPECIRKLHAYHACLMKKIQSEDCLGLHEQLEKRALKYLKFSNKIHGMASDTRMRCVDHMLFYTQSTDGMMASSIQNLRERYDALSRKFEALPPFAKNHLLQEASLQILGLHRLHIVFQQIQAPGFLKKCHDFFVSYLPKENRQKIQSDFANAWEVIEQNKSYRFAHQKLGDTARNCFLHFVSCYSPPFSMLRNIYLEIRETQKKYQDELHSLQQKPADENKGELWAIVPSQLKHWSNGLTLLPVMHDVLTSLEAYEARSTTSKLRGEFIAALRSPQKYSRCAWIKMKRKPDEDALRSLPPCFNPAYVYVEWSYYTGLYYFDQEAFLIESVNLNPHAGETFEKKLLSLESSTILSEDQSILLAELTNHSHVRKIHLYLTLLQLMFYQVEGMMWGVWGRDVMGDERCGLLLSPIEVVKKQQTTKRFPWSYYIYTPDRELYYFCKQDNTLDKCDFYREDDQESFHETFTKTRPLLWPEHLKKIRSLINYTREEDRIITCRKACELAKKEIAFLFRALSKQYHPDTNLEDEKWQRLIDTKTDEAYERLDNLFVVQKELIEEFKLLDEDLSLVQEELITKYYIKKHPGVPEGLQNHVPLWIPQGDPDTDANRATSYYRILLNDMEMEKLDKGSRKDQEDIAKLTKTRIARNAQQAACSTTTISSSLHSEWYEEKKLSSKIEENFHHEQTKSTTESTSTTSTIPISRHPNGFHRTRSTSDSEIPRKSESVRYDTGSYGKK